MDGGLKCLCNSTVGYAMHLFSTTFIFDKYSIICDFFKCQCHQDDCAVSVAMPFTLRYLCCLAMSGRGFSFCVYRPFLWRCWWWVGGRHVLQEKIGSDGARDEFVQYKCMHLCFLCICVHAFAFDVYLADLAYCGGAGLGDKSISE